MGENIKRVKGKLIFKHETEADWALSAYVPEEGEKVLYDPDENYSYIRVKYGDGNHRVADLPFNGQQSDWAEEDDKKPTFIKNKIPFVNGEAENSVEFTEGIAKGKGSFAGGITDKTMFESLLGNGLAENIDINAPKANGDLSVAIGANNDSKAPASLTLGISNTTGINGYFWNTINFTGDDTDNPGCPTITLSTKRPYTKITIIPPYEYRDQNVAPTDGWNSIDWQVGDYICIMNKGDLYSMCAQILKINNGKITVSSLPFTENKYISATTSLGVDLLYPLEAEYIFPHDRAIFAIKIDDEGAEATANSRYVLRNGVEAASMGFGAVATGGKNIGAGILSHAEGINTLSAANASHTEGNSTMALRSNAHAEGKFTEAKGAGSHAEGRSTIAGADYSHAEGHSTTAAALYAHAEGYITEATALAAHVEGRENHALESYSHAEGYMTTAEGGYSHSEGHQTHTKNYCAHAEGRKTTAEGDASHSEGNNTHATGGASHAEGDQTVAYGLNAHSEGQGTVAQGNYSHAEGLGTIACEEAQHAQGKYNASTANRSFIIGGGRKDASGTIHRQNIVEVDWSGNASFAGDIKTNNKTVATEEYVNGSYVIAGHQALAPGARATAEGEHNLATADYAHAEGVYVEALGKASHAEGYGGVYELGASIMYNTASGQGAHAEGGGTIASGDYSHAEGRALKINGANEGDPITYQHSTAKGIASHAEGAGTLAEGDYSHAEGYKSQATGPYAHAEGEQTTASNWASHAEGKLTQAVGSNSHAGGESSIAEHSNSFVHGKDLTTSRNSQFVVGEYNDDNANALFIVGNGTNTSNRRNAFAIKSYPDGWTSLIISTKEGYIEFSSEELIKLKNLLK